LNVRIEIVVFVVLRGIFEMLSWLESFLGQYPNIISFLSMVGTVTAVIVALWLARTRYSKLLVDVELEVTNIHGRNGEIAKVRVSNHGPYPIIIENNMDNECFFWKFLFSEIVPASPSQNKNTFSETIAVGKFFEFDLADQPNRLNTDISPWIKRFPCSAFLMSGYIRFSDGRNVKAKIGKHLRQRIKEVLSS
jgi:hypothetical protein